MSGPRMECGICWWVYDPAEGDDARQIDPGTAFGALPEDWHCPRCDAPRGKFLPVDAGAVDPVTTLRRAFERVGETKMRGLEVFNDALEVETVGFAPHPGGQIGVLVTPWFMSVIYLPSDGRQADLEGRDRIELDLEAGRFAFDVTRVPEVGAIATLGLLSPLQEVGDPTEARQIAEAALAELRRPPPAPEIDPARRSFLKGAWA